MTILDPRFVPVADHALLVEFGTEIDDRTNRVVVSLDRALAASPFDGMREVVPAFVNLLVVFDPLVTDHVAVEAAVQQLLPVDPEQAPPPANRTVSVCYDASLAPDLPHVAAACGISVGAVIDAHLAGDYRVAMYGFAPGYAYMAGVHELIQVPRKATAVRGVAAGSVIITGPQCLVTTIEMPTGWSIIGRSPTQVLQDDPDRPFLFDVGDRVSFERIDVPTFDRLTEGR